jgi:hypothetical protein
VVLNGDGFILGTPAGAQVAWQRVPFNADAASSTASDSDLRQTLLGTWRLSSFQLDLDGIATYPLGDAPQGYLVYTSDGHVLVQFATNADRKWPGPEVLEMTGGRVYSALGFFAYSGTFEVRDSQAIHHVESAILPSWNGRVAPLAVALDGNRLMLGTPPPGLLEWNRVF